MPGITLGGTAFGLGDKWTDIGNRKRKASDRQWETGELQFKIGEDLYLETQPIRDEYFGDMKGFMDNGYVPQSIQMNAPPEVGNYFAPARDALEAQFQHARMNTLEGSPARGGEMAEALLGLEQGRALGVSDLTAQEGKLRHAQDYDFWQAQEAQKQQLYGMGASLSMEAPALSLGGLAQASNTYGNIAYRSMMEQLAREEASREKAQTIASFSMGGGGGGGGGGGMGK